jgi:large subunit ribosomal protein L21
MRHMAQDSQGFSGQDCARNPPTEWGKYPKKRLSMQPGHGIFPIPHLEGIFMTYAIIETGGKQYKVEKDTVIDIEKVSASKGKSVRFDKVLFIADGGKFKLGDALSGAHVTGEIVQDFRAPKVTHFVYKKRKGYHKTRGHRQPLTRVKITAIAAK